MLLTNLDKEENNIYFREREKNKNIKNVGFIINLLYIKYIYTTFVNTYKIGVDFPPYSHYIFT